MLFARRTLGRLAYWLAALGYNLRDRSLLNRLYLVYFSLFWLIWVTAVFALLGASVAGLFAALGWTAAPAAAMIRLAEFSLVAWGWLQLWRAAGRSPLVFGEEDAYLLCQTPVSRRKVGLAWFLQSWLGTALPFAAGTITLAFALVELTPHSGADWLRLGAYFGFSGRALAFVLPLQMAGQAYAWAVGAWRLDRRRRGPAPLPAWLRPAIVALGVVLAAGLVVPGLRGVILVPLSWPLTAALAGPLTAAGWLGRAALTAAYLGSGLALLTAGLGHIHLGRAAQETRLQAAVQAARGSGNFNLAEALTQRQRLPAARAPSRLPARPGAWMLVWKDAVQAGRTLRIGPWLQWGLVFSLGLELLRLSNWPAQLVLGGLWALTLGGLTTARLRNDLAHWWLLRSLPLRAAHLLMADLALACAPALGLSWLAAALSGQPPLLGLLAAALAPLLVASSALAAAHDILRHARVRDLMSPSIAAERVPQQSVEGVIRMVLSVIVPQGMLGWALIHPAQMGWALAALPVAGAITVINLRGAVAAYRWIE